MAFLRRRPLLLAFPLFLAILFCFHITSPERNEGTDIGGADLQELAEVPGELSQPPTTSRLPPPRRPFKGSFDWRQRPTRYPVESYVPLPTARPKRLPRIQHDHLPPAVDATNLQRRSRVKEAFEQCWKGYKEIAWGYDEIIPIRGGAQNVFGGWGASLVDTLDTLLVMDLQDEFDIALQAVEKIDYGQCSIWAISVFETTIRQLGGLLSAYDLCDGQPARQEVLLGKALEVGEMLYAVFDTPNRMPIMKWNHGSGKTGEPQVASAETSIAEIGSMTVEFTRLSQITGDPKWYDAVNRIMRLFWEQQWETELPGMWPLLINPREANVSRGSSFTLGSGADSFYEYFPKGYALLGGLEPMYKDMYMGAIATASSHNLYHVMNPNNYDVMFPGVINTDKSAEVDSSGQHLECYAGGMLALGGRLFEQPEHVDLGRKLTEGCIWAYNASRFGIMPESFKLVPCRTETQCAWNETAWKAEVARNAGAPIEEADRIIREKRLRPGFADIKDKRYLLRPEAIESVFILYRVTGEEWLRDTAWAMFTAIDNYTRTEWANAGIMDVTADADPPPLYDSMESFWMAETLKYFYLIFSEPDLISLDDWVFNTEAHPFRLPKSVG